jgi:hypothetical protein
VPALAPTLRLHAAVNVATRLAELKSQSGSFGFADMLARLDAALDPAAQGPAAERLRQRILAQTPVVLVDEFQDTSPVQARIFDRLYHVLRTTMPGHSAAADRRPQAGHLRLSRCRHLQLPGHAASHVAAATTCWAPTTAPRRGWCRP